jgi:hypothetical protein
LNFCIITVNNQKLKDIYFLLFRSISISFTFRNADSYIFLDKYAFQNIINLNQKKYFHSKRNISLFCVDTLNNLGCSNYYKNKLEQLKYLVDIKSEQPDFLIFDVFGCEHMDDKFNKSVKIARFSENIIPDFSEADYSLSQAHIFYLDRYFKYPIFIAHLKKFINYKAQNIRSFTNHSIKTKFCAAVISNSRNFTSFRMKFIKKLNEYKHVDMGGTYLNNVGGKVKNKIQFLSSYKFSISMENSNGDGYSSEKIIESLIAGTIPIYYGDYLIDEYINPKVYIMIKGQKDIKNKIDYIKKIDNNDTIYNSISRFGLLILLFYFVFFFVCITILFLLTLYPSLFHLYVFSYLSLIFKIFF